MNTYDRIEEISFFLVPIDDVLPFKNYFIKKKINKESVVYCTELIIKMQLKKKEGTKNAFHSSITLDSFHCIDFTDIANYPLLL